MTACRFLKQWLKLDLPLCSVCLLVEISIELKYVVRCKISSRSRICLGESGVLFANLSSCSRRSFMMRRAWSMGMVVQSEVTSKDTIILSGSIFCWHMKAEMIWSCEHCSFSLQ